jgi:hypothetical protein
VVISEHEAIHKNFDLVHLFKTDDGTKKPKPKPIGSSNKLANGLDSLEGSVEESPRENVDANPFALENLER